MPKLYMKVIQLITRNPVMIKHSETIKEAAKVMKKEKVSSVFKSMMIII